MYAHRVNICLGKGVISVEFMRCKFIAGIISVTI